MASADGAHQRLYASRTRRLIDDLEGEGGRPPVVLEVGAGAGPNAAWLPAGTRWVAIEPNVHFRPHLEDAAQRHGLDLEVVTGVAEALPLESGAADAVLSTLVLCSVEDVAQSLSEIRRVLRPGGRFVFVEHVAAPEGSALRRVQRAVRRPWGWIADGCRPDRETERAVLEAGFSHVEVERFRVPLAVVAPHIAGVAVR